MYGYLIQEVRKIDKNILVAYHTDGYAEPVIPDFIEIGIDILEAVQPSCMDPGRLKKKFGRELSFWGGVDVQHVMPFGTPGEVRAQAEERLRVLGRDGGLVFCSIHNIQAKTPVENVLAFFEAALTS